MGNGAAFSGTRYMGGKILSRFFREEMWPTVEQFFDRLNISENRGLEIFKVFVFIDKTESGTIDMNQCLSHIGCRRTKFTERLFFRTAEDGVGKKLIGWNFKDFSIVLWGFCTLSTAGLARFLFEIFDWDNGDVLERPDLEAMYKMLNDIEEADSEYVNIYTFDFKNRIKKDLFISTSVSKRSFIQPAIDFQTRIRKKFGGTMMWESLTSYRNSKLDQYDEDAETLAESLENIVKSSLEFDRRLKQATSEKLLTESSKKLRYDASLAERELLMRERQLEMEKRQQIVAAPDRHMKRAWAVFEQKKRVFEQEEFTLDDVQKRHDRRLELFDLLDQAVEESKTYYEWQDEKDTTMMVGTESDHEARYQDYIKTDEGAARYTLTKYYYLFNELHQILIAKKKKAFRIFKNTARKKSEKELLIESSKIELNRVYDQLQEEGITEQEKEKKIRSLIDRDFSEVIKIGKRYARKENVLKAEDLAHKELCLIVKNQTLDKFFRELKITQEERRKDFIRKDFDLATNFGSRITRWEKVLDKEVNKMIYAAVDNPKNTFMHPKSAICELCDAKFVQHEMRCVACNAPRSANNMKLYRPLGFKDMTLE